MSLSGCGRAGTYAAFEVSVLVVMTSYCDLDHIIDRCSSAEFMFQIAHERLHSDNFQKLNISDCVCRARNGRMHSVQRPIQMQTIHASMMEHIMGNVLLFVFPSIEKNLIL